MALQKKSSTELVPEPLGAADTPASVPLSQTPNIHLFFAKSIAFGILIATTRNSEEPLVRVPYIKDISDEELMRRYRLLYSDRYPTFRSVPPSILKKILSEGGRDAAYLRRNIFNPSFLFAYGKARNGGFFCPFFGSSLP